MSPNSIHYQLSTHRLPVEEQVGRVGLRGVDTVERGQGVLGHKHLRPGERGGVARVLDTKASHRLGPLVWGHGVTKQHRTNVVFVSHVRQTKIPCVRRTQPATLEIETLGSAAEVIVIESVIFIFDVPGPPACPRGAVLPWPRTDGPPSILSCST